MKILIFALLPVIITIALGYFAGWHKNFSEEDSFTLNRMVMLYALPLELLAGILSLKRSELLSNYLLFIWLFIGLVGSYFLFLCVFKFVFKNNVGIAALRALCVSGPSILFVGITVLPVLFNKEDATLTVAIGGGVLLNLILVPATIVFLSGSCGNNNKFLILPSLKSALKEPIVIVPIVSIILVLLGFELPKEIKPSLTLLGRATGGVALFATGIILFAQKVSFSKDVLINVLFKNILMPVIVLGLMFVTKNSASLIHTVTIAMAMPSATISIILSMHFKTYEKEAASTITFTNILSIVSLGAFIYFLK